MLVRFWGTRGSIAKAGPSTLRYGGNTSCVEVRSRAGTLIVLDCGTGAHALGQALVQSGVHPLRGHVLISHTHWDHIQGMPFFAPLFVPGNDWDVYAPRGLGERIRDTLAGQMQYSYFPISLDQLGATIRYHDLVEGQFEAGDVRVTARYLNHPALTLGYRLEADGVCVAYATDHEPHVRDRAAPSNHSAPVADSAEDDRHAAFLRGADVVIHDAQYTAGEYPQKVGWGHSTVEYVVDTAILAGVRRVGLFHHDPLRDDAAVDDLLAAGRARAAAAGASLEVFACAEGTLVELDPVSGARSAAAAPDARRSTSAAVPPTPVLVAVDDPGTARQLASILQADGLLVAEADCPESARRAAAREAPSLLLLDRDFQGADGIALCRELRATSDAPVVMLANADDPATRAAGEAAGVTDWLIRPFTAEYARTRVRAGLLRTRARWLRAPLPTNEATRLAMLRSLNLLDSAPEERFDRLTRLAKHLLRVPIALVSLVDEERQWFKSRQGLDSSETPRDRAFCAHAILEAGPLEVSDTTLDDRFADNPLVTGAPHVRFYAGQPLRAADGSRVGTLCVIDRTPRQLSREERASLADLAVLVEREFLAAPEPAAAPGQ